MDEQYRHALTGQVIAVRPGTARWRQCQRVAAWQRVEDVHLPEPELDETQGPPLPAIDEDYDGAERTWTPPPGDPAAADYDEAP